VSEPAAAVVTALASALVLGVSAVADQRSTKQVQTRRALSPQIIVDLVRQPLWLIAVGANIVGFALQVVALAFGSLALVQPIVACDLMFSVLIGRYVWRRPSATPANMKLMLGGVVATTVGVAGFLAIGQPSGGSTQAPSGILPPLAIGIVVVTGGCLAVAARNQTLGPLALALACGVNYGVAAFLIKLVTSEFGGGPGQVFTNWPIYVLAVVGPAGYILNQDAFQQGTLLAPVQAIISAADPVISIALGIGWLGVVLRGGPANIAGEVVSLLLLTAGIVMTAYHNPSGLPGSDGSAGAPDRLAGGGAGGENHGAFGKMLLPEHHPQTGLLAAQVLSALPGAILGVPLGIVLFKAVGGHQAASPSGLWVAAAVLGTLLAVAGLTTVPALIGARTPAPQILQSETA
jgi:hypothetical protein